MSDIVTVAIISACASVLPTILGFINARHLKTLTTNTNGMQKTIQRLAGEKGYQEGGDQARSDMALGAQKIGPTGPAGPQGEQGIQGETGAAWTQKRTNE